MPDRQPDRLTQKVFLISVEGEKTEPSYFNLFVGREDIVIHIEHPGNGRDHNSSPDGVLWRMNNSDYWEEMGEDDEAWIVVDRDKRGVQKFEGIQTWVSGGNESEPKRFIAVSNPKFECWLLFHFQGVKTSAKSKKCEDQLKEHLLEFKKEILKSHQNKFTAHDDKNIKTAIKRAKNRYKKVANPYKAPIAFTSVYKLVESILEASKKSPS